MPSDSEKLHHVELTRMRVRAFRKLFGDKPSVIYPYHVFNDALDAALIDVLVFDLDLPEMSGRVVAAVTNGVSDRDMSNGRRIELIQYFRECDEDHAARLYDIGLVQQVDGIVLDPFDTLALPDAVDDETELSAALFLPPIIMPHRDFQMEIEGSRTTLLWHVPITAAELAFKKKAGVESLVNRMQEVELPWIFDEAERPDLL